MSASAGWAAIGWHDHLTPETMAAQDTADMDLTVIRNRVTLHFNPSLGKVTTAQCCQSFICNALHLPKGSYSWHRLNQVYAVFTLTMGFNYLVIY